MSPLGFNGNKIQSKGSNHHIIEGNNNNTKKKYI